MAVIAFATIYIIYQNIQVISSFNKITTNINRLNDGLNSQISYLTKLNNIKQTSDEQPLLPDEPKANNNSNLRQQYNTYEPNSFLETDSNISAGEDNHEPEIFGVEQTLENLSPELKSQIDNLFQWIS